MLLYLLMSCWLAPGGDVDAPAPPAEPGAVLTEDGYWYVFSPTASCAYESPCELHPFAGHNVKIEGPLVEGEEVTIRFFHRSKQRRLARVIEGGRPTPAHFLKARRQVALAWTDGEGCEAADGELGCAWAAAEEEWILAQDDVTRREDGSLFYVVGEGEPMWPDVCFRDTNWMDEFERRGVSPTTVVHAMSPTWTGVVPWRPPARAYCLLLSGNARQQAEAAEALLEMVATEGIGLRNEYEALFELGALQRVGTTGQDWLAAAQPTSEHGRKCLAMEQELVSSGLATVR